MMLCRIWFQLQRRISLPYAVSSASVMSYIYSYLPICGFRPFEDSSRFQIVPSFPRMLVVVTRIFMELMQQCTRQSTLWTCNVLIHFSVPTNPVGTPDLLTWFITSPVTTNAITNSKRTTITFLESNGK